MKKLLTCRVPALLLAGVLMAGAAAWNQALAQDATNGTQAASPDTSGPPPEAGTYTVNPGDVLAISVWKEEDLQQQVVVRPDGFFSFPLTGDIRAEGQTVQAIRAEVTARVGKFIPDPVVSIAVIEAAGSKVYVIGQVARPGEFQVNRYIDVVQALAMAGGTTPFAKLDEIRILRREGGTQLAIPFAYSDVAAGKRLQQNIVLEPGDTVLVP